MRGVVLFADDNIHDSDGPEHKLYQLFRNEYVVLTVDNLSHLDHALKSISNFDFIILDWDFVEKDPDFDGLDAKKNPLAVLRPLKLFSKIFVYSNNEIEDGNKALLNTWFPGRVEFRKKNIRVEKTGELESEYEIIKQALDDFTTQNQNLEFTVAWSRAINQSLQGIFHELSAAHSSWLKVLYETSLNDKGNAVLEVVELMNNLLAEELVQDSYLRKLIEEQTNLSISAVPEQGAAKIFQRIYYTKISNPDVPIMTGDIFEFSEEEYAVLITPECDVYSHDKVTGQSKTREMLEVLRFSKKDLLFTIPKPKPGDKEQRKIFNQEVQSRHILPSFPYLGESRLLPAVIIFNNAVRSISSVELSDKPRKYKLNSPYIQQLRQRFSSAHGRVGVPAINDLVKDFNLAQAKEYKEYLEVTAANLEVKQDDKL